MERGSEVDRDREQSSDPGQSPVVLALGTMSGENIQTLVAN